MGRRLPDLVDAIAAEGGFRLRLGSVEPGPCAMETVRAMAGRGNVCRFLHISAQSGSDAILVTMRRRYRAKDVENLARSAASAMPHCGIGCDLIAGFPGETEKDFDATASLLQRLPFSNAHVFPFSSRPGTIAAGLRGQCAGDVKALRSAQLRRIADAKRRNFAMSFVGRVVETVIEDETHGAGWTGEYLWCSADAGRNDAAGTPPRRSLAAVRVVAADPSGSLHGECAVRGEVGNMVK